MFELLKERFLQGQEQKKAKTSFFIEHGFCEDWNEENKKESNEGIRRYCTARRWEQFTNGQIDREKIVSLTIARFEKQLAKDTAEKLAHLEAVEAAPDLQYIDINISWKKSSCYGSHPTAEARTNNGFTSGHAGGWGYDKESAAVAEAFNKNNSILKALYSLKEKALQAGQSDASRTACTGVDNRNICGYGSGYSILPYFEGGVGVSCFWSILEKCGFKCTAHYGKHETFYSVHKMEV